MSEEVRKAAERQLAYLRGESQQDYAIVNDRLTAQFVGDLVTIRDAYLAKHPVDEDEPVTEEWLESVGFWESGTAYAHDCMQGGLLVNVKDWRTWEWHLHGHNLASLKTRSDVRRLCRALGVELKESP